MTKASGDGDRRPPGHSSACVAPGLWGKWGDGGEGRIPKHKMRSCNEKPKGGYTPEALSYRKISLSKERSEWEKKAFGFCKGNNVSEQNPITPEG